MTVLQDVDGVDDDDEVEDTAESNAVAATNANTAKMMRMSLMDSAVLMTEGEEESLNILRRADTTKGR